jgi:small neutral amino acid transporter SnatA (MarC family)
MLRTVVFFVIAVDPFGAAIVLSRCTDRVTGAVFGLATAVALWSLAAGAGPWVLDRLDISPEAAAIAAGVVLLVPAVTLLASGDQLYLLGAGDRGGGWRAGIVPLAVPLLAGPAPLAVVAALAARRGRGDAFVAIAVAFAVAACTAWVATRRQRDERSLLEGIAGRAVGAAMVVVSFALIVDGVLGV